MKKPKKSTWKIETLVSDKTVFVLVTASKTRLRLNRRLDNAIRTFATDGVCFDATQIHSGVFVGKHRKARSFEFLFPTKGTAKIFARTIDGNIIFHTPKKRTKSLKAVAKYIVKAKQEYSFSNRKEAEL